MNEGRILRSDFHVSFCQLSLFFNAISFESSHLLIDLLVNFGDMFDGNPLSIPIPPGAPPEIPRVVLTKKAPSLKLEVCLSRINFYQLEMSPDDNVDFAAFYTNYFQTCFRIAELFKTPVNRMAGLLTRVADYDTPGILLARHFCQDKWKEKPLNRPECFELHSHKKFNIYEDEKQINPLMVNSWVRNKTGIKQLEGRNSNVIIVEQDINTLAEDKNVFTSQDVEKFFSVVPVKMKQIFELYYPEE